MQEMNFEFKCQLADDEKGQSAKDVCLNYLRIFLAEFIGTFLLVYFGCACIHHLSNFLGMSLCFGFVIGAIIQAVGAISLAHLNPAVTLCFYIFGIISLPAVFLYVIAECLGAILGAFLLKEMSIFDAALDSRGTKSDCCTLVVTELH
uniref:Aquaporin-like protein isoform x1 n=1 Tax=Triatoma infestans TaxID=30076 RepID=A0A161MLN8_TRIIF